MSSEALKVEKSHRRLVSIKNANIPTTHILTLTFEIENVKADNTYTFHVNLKTLNTKLIFFRCTH